MTYAEIGSMGELRELLGVPTGRAVTKERTRLHVMDREWLAISPFCVLATSDADGNCDAAGVLAARGPPVARGRDQGRAGNPGDAG